jgi:hypothetical protein
MYQPSANQIANLYQGNPQALQQRVNQEPKGPAGLPADLAKVMALNIDLTEQDAAKRQAALASLQQMQQQSPTGEPPTVAQTIQQQAAQKAKELAVQQQRQQQGLQALAQQQGLFGAVPDNVPQPQRQPSGLDELTANLGEHYAGGGIIAFAKPTDENNRSLVNDPDVKDDSTSEPYETPYDRRNRLLNESGERFGKPSKESISQAEIPKAENVEFTPEGLPRSRSEQAEVIARNKAISATQANAQRLGDMQKLRLQQMQNPQISPEYLQQMKEFYKPRREPSGIENLVVQQGATYPESGATQKQEVVSNKPAAQTKDLAQLAAQKQLTTNTNPAATKPAAPAATAAPAAPAEQTAYDKYLDMAMAKTPEERRNEALARYKEQIGAPDTSAQQNYIKQLEESRKRFAEPEDTMGQLRNWLRTAANAGGRHWFETGARTSALEEARKQGNAQKDIETLRELMGESAKVADINRNYRKEALSFGEKEYDDAFRNGLEAAKAKGLDIRQQQLFAHQSAEGALDRANRIAVAGMPSSDQKEFNVFSKDWLSKPENTGKTVSDAYSAFKLAGQGFRPEQARVGMIEKYASDWNKMDIVEKNNLKKDNVNNASDYVKYMMDITNQAKPGATPTVGAPITKAQYDALPKGASYTAPDGSQRVKG